MICFSLFDFYDRDVNFLQDDDALKYVFCEFLNVEYISMLVRYEDVVSLN